MEIIKNIWFSSLTKIHFITISCFNLRKLYKYCHRPDRFLKPVGSNNKNAFIQNKNENLLKIFPKLNL